MKKNVAKGCVTNKLHCLVCITVTLLDQFLYVKQKIPDLLFSDVPKVNNF
jgi:hypothetical protein